MNISKYQKIVESGSPQIALDEPEIITGYRKFKMAIPELAKKLAVTYPNSIAEIEYRLGCLADLALNWKSKGHQISFSRLASIIPMSPYQRANYPLGKSVRKFKKWSKRK